MQTSWDLTKTLSDISDDNISKLKKQSEGLIDSFAKKYSTNKSYLKNSADLLQSLKDYENIIATDPANILGQYFGLANVLDQSNSEIISQLTKLTSWSTQLANQIQFYTLSLGKISKEKQEEFLSDRNSSCYHKFLKHIFDNAKYNLSESEEKILNIASPFARGNWADLTERLLSEESHGGKNLPQLVSETSNIDKQTRDQAATAVTTIFDKHKITAEVEINNIFNYKKELDNLRGVLRPDLLRHISDDIDTKTVDTLRNSVTSAFDIPKEFYKLKAQLLGLPILAYHERNVPYGKTETKYSWQEAYNLTHKVFANIDSEFSTVLDSYFNNGQVDVFPKQGKRGGAFCSMGSKNTRGYVLLNHTNRLQDVLTLAHEFGHAVNHEFIRNNSSALYMENSLAMAEVASTFFEDFVLEELEKNAPDEELLAIYMSKLNDDVSTIFRQIACYQFEWDLHHEIRQRGHLSYKEIGQIFQKNMASYMGDYVEQGEGSNLYWIYWSHIRNHFYVYSYASGLLISKTLQNLLRQDKNNITKIKKFLSAGTDRSPHQIFLEMGLDINQTDFWKSGISEIRELLEKTKKLAVKLGKI